ncbi:MAG: family 20 glycosylhydrolase [Candidatus Saccharimonadaceae bacterium]|nr:family 20 glycosylhydrolase [Candidatus Saccharimonadaceae bacterium]
MSFSLKLAQIDLARQFEPLGFIENFITMMADCGYNGVLLYLEDRVRTASYQLAGEGEYYTADDIRHLVEFAKSKNMELIPCVGTLGHAERFLKHHALEKFGELNSEGKGRFGGTRKSAFCITHPEFYDFIGKYLTEVAELFPSQWFHIGLDEFWDYNLCDRCKQQMPNLAAEQQYFLEHVKKIRALLDKCGKRVMMWSDMFEYYPEIFAEIPRDIVMVDWQYQQDMRRYIGHLLDLGVEDRAAVNHELGFETIIAPAERYLSSSITSVEYAKDRAGVIGFLLTSWEKTDTFLYRTLPIFVATGYFMQTLDRDAAFSAMGKMIFGSDDPVLLAATRLALSIEFWRHFNSVADAKLLTISFFGLAYNEIESDLAACRLLKASRNKVTTSIGLRCLDDMCNALEEKLISHRLKKSAHDIFENGWTAERGAEFAAGITDFERYLDRMAQFWNEWRPGVAPNVFTDAKPKQLKRLHRLADNLSSNNWVKLSFCLPDIFGIENCSADLLIDGQWVAAGSGVFKGENENNALFSRYLPLPPDISGRIEEIRLTAWGMGGIGITFAEAKIAGVRYVPAALKTVTGKVCEPAAILDEDSKFSWFGGQSTRYDYFNEHASAQRHSVRLLLEKFTTGKLSLPGSI